MTGCGGLRYERVKSIDGLIRFVGVLVVAVARAKTDGG